MLYHLTQKLSTSLSENRAVGKALKVLFAVRKSALLYNQTFLLTTLEDGEATSSLKDIL